MEPDQIWTSNLRDNIANMPKYLHTWPDGKLKKNMENGPILAAAPEMLELIEDIAASDDPEADGLLARCETLAKRIRAAREPR